MENARTYNNKIYMSESGLLYLRLSKDAVLTEYGCPQVPTHSIKQLRQHCSLLLSQISLLAQTSVRRTYSRNDFSYHVLALPPQQQSKGESDQPICMVCVTTQQTVKEKVEQVFQGITQLINKEPKGISPERLRKLMMSVQVSQSNGQEEQDERFSSLERDIDELKGLVHENVQHLFRRGEQVDSLLKKADTFETTTFKIRNRARMASRQLWWKKIRCRLILAVLFIMIMGWVGFELSGGVFLPL